jgi:prepilin-type N-terminal cleavage/methylation domain-containing protein
MLTPPRKSRAVKRTGMTLIEVVTVLAILGIIGGVAITRLNTVAFKMDAAARITHSTIQQAQRLALMRQFDVIVSFDEPTRRIRIGEDANNDGTIAVDERFRWKALEDSARFDDPPSSINGGGAMAIQGQNIRDVDGMPSIIFRRSGSASSDLEVYLGSLRGDPDDFRGVLVTQSTGRVEWYKHVGGQWRPGGI